MHNVEKARNLRFKKTPNYHNSMLARRQVINYTVLRYVVLLPHTRHRDNYENHTFHRADLQHYINVTLRSQFKLQRFFFGYPGLPIKT